MRRFCWMIAVISSLAVSHAQAFGNGHLIRWSRDAASADVAVSGPAITKLRDAGPVGLAALLQTQKTLLVANPADQTTNERLLAAIDTVGGQFQCVKSGFYWYTDLEAAKDVSRTSGKPIISLHMLGKLTDEFSCANSRFFRSTLYANAEISQMLRDNFILHWHSVRPVPKVTIDFGDGRKLESTVTGNSIHYVLDAEGQPLDGLPGLYGPKAFARWLTDVQQLAVDVAKAAPEHRAEELALAHANRAKLSDTLWNADRAELGLPFSTKEMSDADWAKLAAYHARDAQLDPATKALIRAQAPLAARAGRLAITKRLVEDPFVALIRNLQGTIALDSVRNEYTFHRQIHQWFADGENMIELGALNNRIYNDLFLTPSNDPWLGLLPAGAYSGLVQSGVRVEKSELAAASAAE